MFRGTQAGERVARGVKKAIMRRVAPLILTLGLCLTPQPASAVTVNEIVTLAKAGISDAVILALLDRDRTVLTIAPEDLIVLKQDGLSDGLIMAMLKSGREEGEAAARADSEANAARILASLSPVPELTIVGHGPDRPNSGYFDDVFPGGPVVATVPVPLGVPYASSLRPSFGQRSLASGAPRFAAPLCVAQVNSPGAAAGSLPVYRTECPQSTPRTTKRSAR
jgi:hypothetical protein